MNNTIPIDADIQKLAYDFAHQALAFLRDTGDDPCMESVSQWSSLENALAAPVQRMRNHARAKKEHRQS